MIQLREDERNRLRDLLQATSDVIQTFKNRRSIEAFDLYPITVIDTNDKWHNVTGIHIGFWTTGARDYTRLLMEEVRAWLRSQSDDEVHDPTWWDKYKVRWFVEGNLIAVNEKYKFWVQLRLKRRW
jgi:hypothetical protein